MKSYLTLSLILGSCLITAYCEEEHDSTAEHADNVVGPTEGDLTAQSSILDFEPEEGEGGELSTEVDATEVDEMDTDDEEDDEGGKPHYQDGDDDSEDDGEMEKMDPLTDEQMTALHKKIDANSNGKVSLAEASDFAHKMRRQWANTEVKEIISDMDVDKDGKVSAKEFIGAHGFDSEKDRKVDFEKADLNKDGIMSEDEIASHHHFHHSEEVETLLTNRAMQDKDKDKNGALTLEEFFHHLQQEGEDPVEIHEDDKDMFKKLDTDGSGSLTLKELKPWESGHFEAENAVKAIFAKADDNKDNVLTVEELIKNSPALAADDDYAAQMALSQWAGQNEEHGHSEL